MKIYASDAIGDNDEWSGEKHYIVCQPPYEQYPLETLIHFSAALGLQLDDTVNNMVSAGISEAHTVSHYLCQQLFARVAYLHQEPLKPKTLAQRALLAHVGFTCIDFSTFLSAAESMPLLKESFQSSAHTVKLVVAHFLGPWMVMQRGDLLTVGEWLDYVKLVVKCGIVRRYCIVYSHFEGGTILTSKAAPFYGEENTEMRENPDDDYLLVAFDIHGPLPPTGLKGYIVSSSHPSHSTYTSASYETYNQGFTKALATRPFFHTVDEYAQDNALTYIASTALRAMSNLMGYHRGPVEITHPFRLPAFGRDDMPSVELVCELLRDATDFGDGTKEVLIQISGKIGYGPSFAGLNYDIYEFGASIFKFCM